MLDKVTKEAEQIAALIDFLYEKGFSHESALTYGPVLVSGQVFRPDILLAEPKQNRSLAVIEIIKEPLTDGAFTDKLRKKLSRYSSLVDKEGISVYACHIRTSDGKHQFQFYHLLPEGFITELSPGSFPTLRDMSSGIGVIDQQKFDQEKQKTSDTFKITCFVLAGIAFLALVTDFILAINGILFLTIERLSLAAFVIALIVLPFAAKFRLLGFEFERLKSKSQQSE